MRTFFLAPILAVILGSSLSPRVIAQPRVDESARIASIASRLAECRTARLADTLLLIDCPAKHSVFVVIVDTIERVRLVAEGSIASGNGRSSVDMEYLDAAAVGSLELDVPHARWILVHRLDPQRVTDAELEDVLRRFVDAAASIATRADRLLVESDARTSR
jgi:hypothetical protein